MTRLLLPLSLILLFSCKGKEKPAPATKDSLAYLEYAEQGYGGPVEGDSFTKRTKHFVDSIEAILTDGAIFGPVTYGFKRVHHKKKKLTDWSKFVDRYDTIKFSGPDINKKQYWNGQEITHAQDSGWTVGDEGKSFYEIDSTSRKLSANWIISGTSIASPPMFRITSWRITDISDSGKIVAIRDSAGHWDIKDPARALEVMYKIVNHKDR